MEKDSVLERKAGLLRNEASKALRLADGLPADAQDRLTRYGDELRAQADELERQVTAATQSSRR